MLTGDTETIITWKKKGLFDESIKVSIITPGNGVAPKLKWIDNSKIAAEFRGSCFEQDKATFTHGNVGDLFLVYELDTQSIDLNTRFTLSDCLFGAVKLTENAHPDKYEFGGCDVGYAVRSTTFDEW